MPRRIAGSPSQTDGFSIIGTDLDGIITVFDSGAERMLGASAAEVLSTQTPIRFHDAREIVARAGELGIDPGFEVLVHAARGGQAETREWTYIDTNGSRLSVELTVTAMLDAGHEPCGFIVVGTDLAARQRAEDELCAGMREAEIMETAFSDAPGGIAIIAMDGRFLRVNQSLCDILGRSAEELVGSTSAAFSHPGDASVTAEAFNALRASGARIRADKRYLRPDGQVVWVSTTGTAVAGPDGKPDHIVSHFRDVTEQQAAGEQLRASEENLRRVAAVARELPSHENPRQAICDAGALISGADIVQWWEPDGADRLRITAATGIELDPDLRLPLTGEITGTAMAFHSRERGLFLDLFEPGAPVSAPVRDRLGAASALCEPVIGREGALGVLLVMWKTAISHASAPVIDAVGLLATEAAAAIERADLTARLSAQAQKEELRLRQLLEGAPDAMIITGLTGTIQSVNEQTVRLFGYRRDELIGCSLDSLVPAGDGERPFHGHPAFTAERVVQIQGAEYEQSARHKDGTEIPVSITLSPVHTEDGTLITVALRDIGQRLAEQERLRTAEERFRRSFDDAPIGMTITGLDGRYRQVNDAFCAIVGYPRAELIDGLARGSITHPDDIGGDDQAVAELLAGKAKFFVREQRFLHAEGHVVWVALSVTVIRDARGEATHFITQAQDITDRRRYEDQLRYMADHDPLTGLLNRRSFERELDSHVAKIRRYGAAGAVLMLDLDNFKYYNDTKGHSAGDDLIVRIGRALQTRLRESDSLARLGGDEFAVLLPREDRDSAEIVARDLLELVRSEAPPPLHGEQRRITASIGIACFADGDRLSGEEITVNADLAMYDAKEGGRDRVVHYSTDDDDRPGIESQMKWASEITQALAEGRFELLAQPIELLNGSGPTQYELLLRMIGADGDQIPPGTFLGIAERLGMIQEIDRWVVARAIEMLAEQRACGHDMRFEINLSGHSIGDPELLELIERRLQESGVPPDRLIFEITETAAVANIARASAFADRLSGLGCRFALDDFGAGFGSFYYLKHLPFDYLKIDGEFVRHCTTNATDRVLISAVVQIARGLGKHTIAEFVGDQESVDLLTELGVDYGQGYFLGRPKPLAAHLADQQAPHAASQA